MHRAQTVLHQAGLLTVLSVVAGLLMVGLALPVVGGFGIAAKAANTALSALPTSLDEPPLAQQSVLRAADGSVLATLAGAEDRVVVPLADVPAVMQKSIVAIEDNRFYEHRGVDVRGLLRAVRTNAGSGDFSQGASTITQQYVKNVLLEQAGRNKQEQHAATEKSISRKLREARYAIALEKKLTKAQILERYLNIAYFGEGVYGVATAAQHYFQVPVSQLSLAQAALLAGLVNNPSGFDPVAHPQAATDRRNLVLDALDRYGFLPHAQTEAAQQQPLGVHPAQRATDACAVSSAPFFCRYAIDELLSDPKLGPDLKSRQQALFEGGLDISTTLNPKVQRAVDAGIRANVGFGITPLESVVTVEPGTGKVLAVGQNRNYGDGAGQTKFIYADKHSYDTGSTFKAVTLATALEQGLPLTTSFESPACLPLPGTSYVGHGTQHCPDGPANAGDSESGTFNLVTGTWQSVNTFYVQLERKVGVLAVRDMARRLGDAAPGLDRLGSSNLSLTLGTAGGTSTLDLATMYATLAAHGRECDPRVIDHITAQDGHQVDVTQRAPCRQQLDPSIADEATSILQGVLDEPAATANGKGIGRPAAGKTGTVDNYNGAWFVGYVPQYVTAVGLFNPTKPNTTVLPITSLRTGHYFADHLYGGDIPADTWQSIMTQATQGDPVLDFARPQQGDVSAPPPAPPASPAPPTPPPPPTNPTPAPAPAPPGQQGKH